LGALNYQWSQGIVDGTAFSLTANGAYTVTGTDLNGCSNTASISVAAVPVPGAFTIIGDTLVITPQQYTYTVPVGTNEIVTWTVTGGTIVGGQGTSSLVVSWGPASPNSIAATVNNVLGCGSSFVQPVFVTGSVGIAEMGSSAIRLFPNPANDVVWLEFQEAEERTIRLTDLRGRLAGSWTSNAKRIALHPDGTLASGLYQLIINDNQGTTAQLKLVLLR